MYIKEDLIKQLEKMDIERDGTIIVHSSMKAIGQIEGGADTVLDALSDYMEEGLLVLPTITWASVNKGNPNFYVENTETCIGLLTEMFWKRPHVIRSLHPTHSVAALGEDAVSFTEDHEQFDTPCAKGSPWGKLLEREAKILLVGVDFRRNTFIHGIEEWMDIPGRLTDSHEQLYTVLSDGRKISVPSRRHCGLDWSEHYWKVEGILEKSGAIKYGKLGNAIVIVCDTVKLHQDISNMLTINPALFSDNEPLDEEKYSSIF